MVATESDVVVERGSNTVLHHTASLSFSSFSPYIVLDLAQIALVPTLNPAGALIVCRKKTTTSATLPSSESAWNCHLGNRLPEFGMNGVGGTGEDDIEGVMRTLEMRCHRDGFGNELFRNDCLVALERVRGIVWMR